MPALLSLLCLMVLSTRTDADLLFNQGRYQEAAEVYASLIRQTPLDPSLLHAMGQTLRAMHQPGEAIVFLTRETEFAPEDLQASRSLAAALQEANQLGEGRRLLLKLTESNPRDAESWFRLGLLMYQNGYYIAAIEALDRALSSPGKEVPAAPGTVIDTGERAAAESARAISLMQCGRTGEAEGAFRLLLAQPANARNLDLLLGYVRVLYESGRYESAMQLAAQAVQAEPGNASGHFWRARILQQQERWPEAATEAERSRDLAPGSPAPRNLLIRIYQKLGRTNDAEKEARWIREHQTASGAPQGNPVQGNPVQVSPAR